MLGHCCNVERLLSMHADYIKEHDEVCRLWAENDELRQKVERLEQEIVHFEEGCRCCRGTRPIHAVDGSEL